MFLYISMFLYIFMLLYIFMFLYILCFYIFLCFIKFIFYLHKALKNSKLSSSRDIELDTSHDHNYTIADKHKKITKVQKAFTIEQQYADYTYWATTNIKIIEEIKQTIPTILTNKNLIVNQDKKE